MRRAGWVMTIVCCLAGCQTSQEERILAYNEDGVYLYQKGDYASARESFQAALQLRPNDAAILYNLAQCYEREGALAKAEQGYRDCLKQAPNHADSRYALTHLLVRTGQRPEAVQLVGQWISEDPKSSTAYAADGWLYKEAGDLPRAQARLQEALERDPRNLRALMELALVFEAMSRPDRALVLYERVLDVSPGHPEAGRRVNELRTRGVRRPEPD